jgi:hypothetical protein
MSTDSTGRDQDLLQRYQAASAESDERPSAAVRASILAAAAREVNARPTDSKVTYRTRWPLAAAAAVMLSTLAVMLAIRTSEEMPQFEAPAESSRARQAPAAPPVVSEPVPPDSKAKAIEESQPVPMPQRADKRADGERFGESAPASRRVQPPTQPPQAAVESREQAAASAATDSVSGAATPATKTAPRPAAAPAPDAKLRKDEAEVGALATRPLDRAAEARDAPRQEAPAARGPARPNEGRSEVAPAAPPEPSMSMAELNKAELSAASWLERIIRLRREGRHDEADAELKRFRERYPQVQVPPEAMAPAGTR